MQHYIMSKVEYRLFRDFYKNRIPSRIEFHKESALTFLKEETSDITLSPSALSKVVRREM